MNAFEKWAIALSAILLGVFFYAVLDARKKGVDLPKCVPPGTQIQEGKVVKVGEKKYQIFYVSRMWSFEPAKVEIPAGSEVEFYLVSKDVVHGFQIPGKNVNMTAVYGSVNRQDARFDKPGTYHILCHEYCGFGHQFMQGEIAVQ